MHVTQCAGCYPPCTTHSSAEVHLARSTQPPCHSKPGVLSETESEEDEGEAAEISVGNKKDDFFFVTWATCTVLAVTSPLACVLML